MGMSRREAASRPLLADRGRSFLFAEGLPMKAGHIRLVGSSIDFDADLDPLCPQYACSTEGWGSGYSSSPPATEVVAWLSAELIVVLDKLSRSAVAAHPFVLVSGATHEGGRDGACAR